MNNKKYTEKLVNFLMETNFNDLSEDVVRITKQLILDTIGCAFGGYQTERGKITVDFIRSIGGKPESTVIGCGDRTSVVNAAYANCKMVNALDWDELWRAMAHFGPLMPCVAFSTAEHVGGITGKDIITAVCMGYEVVGRYDLAAGTQTFPAIIFGPTITASRILGLSNKQVMDAFGLAGQIAIKSARGPSEYESMSKYMDFGWVGFLGTSAALLAEKGHDGTHTQLDPGGFPLAMMRQNNFDYDLLIKDFGDIWTIREAYFKPYSCCAWFQAAIGMLKKIMGENNLTPEDIDEITWKTWLDVEEAGKSGWEIFSTNWSNYKWKTKEACHSPTLNLTLGALGVPPGHEWHSPKWKESPRVSEFSRKIKLEYHPEYATEDQKNDRISITSKEYRNIIIVSAKGKIFEEDNKGHAKGEVWSEYAMTDEELQDKFKANTIGILREDQIDKIISIISALENVEDVRVLTELFESLPGEWRKRTK